MKKEEVRSILSEIYRCDIKILEVTGLVLFCPDSKDLPPLGFEVENGFVVIPKVMRLEEAISSSKDISEIALKCRRLKDKVELVERAFSGKSISEEILNIDHVEILSKIVDGRFRFDLSGYLDIKNFNYYKLFSYIRDFGEPEAFDFSNIRIRDDDIFIVYYWLNDYPYDEDTAHKHLSIQEFIYETNYGNG